MNPFYTHNYIITPEYCGKNAAVTPTAVFTIFQSIATMHAELLGVGGAAMQARKEFWLTVHTRVDFEKQAYLMQELTATTWAEACKPSAFRVYRSYTLNRGEDVIAKGRTEWAILGGPKGLLPFGETGFDKNYPFPEEVSIPEKPKRFKFAMTEEDFFKDYTVQSTDIDMGKHMNNVAYVRCLMSCLSADRLVDGSIRSVEVHYSTSCYEGEPLKIYRQTEGNVMRMSIQNGEGKTAIMAEITFRE